MTENVAVLFDYQNVHLTGHSLFSRGNEPYGYVPDPAHPDQGGSLAPQIGAIHIVTIVAVILSGRDPLRFRTKGGAQ